MIVSETFKLALRSLKRNKIRSFLTMLGIIIGVASVILLTSIGSGMKNYITQAFEDLGADLLMIMPGKIVFRDSREGGPPGIGSNKLSLKDSQNIKKKSKFIIQTVPILNTSITVKYRGQTHSTFLLGTTPDYQTVRNSPVKQGRFFSQAQYIGRKKVAVIGLTVQQKLFPSQTNPLGKKITINKQLYTVIGILDKKGGGLGNDQDDQIIIPLTQMQRQFNLDKLNYIYAQAASTDVISQAKTDIKKILGQRLNEDEFSIVDSSELLQTITQVLNVLTAGLAGIAAISLVVGGIGIMNIMLVSVTERTKEIGLRKAVGAKPADIRLQFIIEAVTLSLAGGTLGIILGTIGSLVLNRFIQTSVTLWAVILAFVFSSLVGVIFGVAPAGKAAKLNPIDALHYQ